MVAVTIVLSQIQETCIEKKDMHFSIKSIDSLQAKYNEYQCKCAITSCFISPKFHISTVKQVVQLYQLEPF